MLVPLFLRQVAIVVQTGFAVRRLGCEGNQAFTFRIIPSLPDRTGQPFQHHGVRFDQQTKSFANIPTVYVQIALD